MCIGFHYTVRIFCVVSYENTSAFLATKFLGLKAFFDVAMFQNFHITSKKTKEWPTNCINSQPITLDPSCQTFMAGKYICISVINSPAYRGTLCSERGAFRVITPIRAYKQKGAVNYFHLENSQPRSVLPSERLQTGSIFNCRQVKVDFLALFNFFPFNPQNLNSVLDRNKFNAISSRQNACYQLGVSGYNFFNQIYCSFINHIIPPFLFIVKGFMHILPNNYSAF